jgi:predicted nuclease of restriction endonuclease-like RecB superfamily
MLTGTMVRVRFARDRVLPHYLNTADPSWREVAERLLELFRGQDGRTRGELEEERREVFGDDPGQLVHQGLVKLLEDRCEFETVAGHPPEELRDLVFRQAAEVRRGDTAFDRAAILAAVGTAVGLDAEQVEQGLFADLRSEQRLKVFKDISADRLLQRYNVALAQAVLLRAIRVRVVVRGETPARYRQLFRYVKFHRLICEVEQTADGCVLTLDGPLSLFTATQKYGLQLAQFLPTVLHCRDFELTADLRWGPQKKPKTFLLTPKDGLVSHLPDTGTYVPPELAMFAELFRKRIADWELIEETEIYQLGSSWWVPDFRLVHKASGQIVRLEVLGFWRKSSAEKHLARLREHIREPFLLAVSDQLHIEESGLEGLAAGVHRFRNLPLADEIARLAGELLTHPRQGS